MRTPPVTAPAPPLLRTLVLLAALVAAACPSTRTFREAQAAFSEAAALDNATRVDPKSAAAVEPESGELGTDVVASSAAEVLYRRAHRLLVELVDEDAARLKEDDLWVSALTLKALAEWRLREWDDAADTAVAAAATEPGPSVGRRDRVLLLALPGLVRNDQAFALLHDDPDDRLRASREARDLLRDAADGRSADAILDSAHDEARGHPVEVYVLTSRLAVLKNYFDACALVQEEIPADARDQARSLLAELDAALPDTPASADLVGRWRAALQL